MERCNITGFEDEGRGHKPRDTDVFQMRNLSLRAVQRIQRQEGLETRPGPPPLLLPMAGIPSPCP